MNTRSFVVAAVVALLCTAMPAHAHRLDEVLQATTIRLAQDHVTVAVRLTPGVAVFRPFMAAVDTDGDGAISDAEGRAYAERVGRDLSLAIDEHPAPLRLTSWAFPPVEAMRGDSGEIALQFQADVPPGGPDRTLAFDNHHNLAGAASVYLVNCLVPRDPDLRITAQDRSYNQSTYRLTYAVTAHGAPPPPPPSWGERTGTGSLVRAYLYHGVHHILTG
jgi:hypothetical protein